MFFDVEKITRLKMSEEDHQQGKHHITKPKNYSGLYELCPIVGVCAKISSQITSILPDCEISLPRVKGRSEQLGAAITSHAMAAELVGTGKQKTVRTAKRFLCASKTKLRLDNILG